MSTWALVVMVLLVLLAAGIVLVAMRRGGRDGATVAGTPSPPEAERPAGRTVGDLVRDRYAGAPTDPGATEPTVPAEAAAPAGEDPVTAEDAATAEDAPAAPADTPAENGPEEPPAERRVVAEEIDAGPVGPPWTRGFVDGVPVEAPPRIRPQRRSAVDPALVARVTSVAPPTPNRDDRPMARGIVSPAVAEAVARAEASRRRRGPEAPSDETGVPAPRDGGGQRPMLAVVRGGADDGRDVRRLRSVPSITAMTAGATAASLAEPVLAGPVVVEEPEEHPVEQVAEPVVEESVVEESVADVPVVETVAAEEPLVEEPPAEESVVEESVVEEALVEEPLVEEPVVEEAVAAEEPVVEAPVAETVEGAVDAAPEPTPEPTAEPTAEPATSPDPEIDTPAAEAAPGPVTLRPVSPTTSAPEPAPLPAGTDTAPDEARAAEHAAVDLALLRTLGFADPNPRPGAAPVVDLAVVHEEEEPPAPGQAVPVRFLVVQRDRLPVADATVTLLDPRGRETASASADVAGRGEVTAPCPGGYVLVAAANGHQPGVVALTVPDTEYAVAEVEVQLVRSSTIAGAVRDVRGSGVAAVAVSLLQDGELVATTITTPAGGYRFGELAAGEYKIAVVAEGREPRALPVRVDEEADAAQDVVLTGPVAQPAAAGEH
ncbi:carboxypeptidase regulatory-like domain-containing protein [Pseudonocardia kujensis]|uniref:carboxypeptidase-like regulatory domain-containing protein n=1 Tax=Pseudonocardia kujensis TaxID=1128675 RepID=UPI001E46E245|nr:carboxypeptidase-like regulatory domain-containing protein [Pseudonocardia kujensis]MCE0768666.1 carboxypeptidase regulatory-like domain-containing protein [Pseudonocardia kujensis]